MTTANADPSFSFVEEEDDLLGEPEHVTSKGKPDDEVKMNVRLELARWGTFEAAPAALLVLKMAFDFPPHASSRVTKAKMAITFAGGPTSDACPIVAKIAPLEARSCIDTVTKIGHHQDVEASLTAPVPGSPGVKAGVGRTTERERATHTTISGYVGTSNTRLRVDDFVEFKAVEDKTKELGVPRLMWFAILLRLKGDQPFQAKVKVSFSQANPMWNVWRSLWSNDDDPQDGLILFNRNGQSVVGPKEKENILTPAVDWQTLDLSPLVALPDIGMLPRGY